jgi:transketolase
MLKMPSQEFQAESNRLRMRMFEVAKKAGGGHLGGSFSVIDVLFFLYAEVLNIDSNDSRNPTRDRLILSKGHSCLALYVCLEKFGFIASFRRAVTAPCILKSFILRGSPSVS